MKRLILALSIICLPILAQGQFWEHHWIDQNYVFSGSGGNALTVTKTDCEEAFVQVTDPAGAPLPSFSPIIINPQNAEGDDITDISSFAISFTMRARSAEQVIVGALFRSDDGTSDFRSSILYDTIPAGLERWSEITIEFTGEDISGFNAGNLRDFWFFLDRGSENFAGNELYIDYISLGGGPSPGLESPCEPGSGPGSAIFAEYFSGDEIRNINTGSSAAQVSTFTLDTICETLQISITDPENAPLPAFNAYQINPFNDNGEEITDISAGVNVTMRLRSAEQINIDILFRSGEGASDERSDRKSVSIPGDLEAWTTFTMEFDSSEYAGFDPSDLRDMWLYLDRGTENFAGNELYIDHIAIGGLPDTTLNSPCSLVEPAPSGATFAEYFQDDSLKTVNTGSTAGQVTTFTLDTLCETLQISVTDPINAPLPSFNAYIINPIDDNGNEITDISDNINVSMRVRSLEAVNIDLLFRSGEGTSDERTERKTVSIPGGLDQWTSFTVEFAPTDLAGFDPADLRDFWFYLDRGTPNFAGNELYIDYILIGAEPDSARFSPCSIDISSQAWLENWDTDNPVLLGGAETAKLTVTQTECEEIKIEVTDPEGNPHQAFRPIVINPLNATGSEVSNISENIQVVIRARSAEEVPISVLFRSGDGSADFRTALLTQNVAGTLDAWTTLTFTFSAEDLGGFDPEDLIDLWIFLDRDNNNFPGNEIYFDYIAIGEQPDSSLNSPCGLPDITVSTNELAWIDFFEVFPNPVKGQLQITFDPNSTAEGDHVLRLFNASGQLLYREKLQALHEQFSLDVSDVPSGLLFLQISSRQYHFTKRLIKK